MKKVIAAYTLLAVVLAAICCWNLWTERSYHVPLYAYATLDGISLTVEGDEVASAEITPIPDTDYGTLTIESLRRGPGTCDVVITGHTNIDSFTYRENTVTITYHVEVLRSGLLLVNNQLVGAMTMLACVIVYLFALAIGLGARFVLRVRKGLLCTYSTVASLAFFLFSGASAITLAFVLFLYTNAGEDLGLSALVQTIGAMAAFFNLVAIPVVVLVSLFLVLSNLSLIRHEGMRPTNLLGIAVGAFAALCYLALFLIQHLFVEQTALSYSLNIAIPYLVNLFGTIFAATAICGLLAAKRTPRFDKDFVIILGCGIRKDGTPTPLLAGRCQRAIDFARAQVEKTGKQPRFVCSGGQGPDEVVSEAASMAGYLREQGIDDELVLLEEKSTTTWENMHFSRKIIDDNWNNEGRPKVAYSTTNYHVFRSGTFALGAGLAAEGMGAKTKWYFWPNAFLREFAGFLVASKVAVALSALSVILFSVALAMTYRLLM